MKMNILWAYLTTVYLCFQGTKCDKEASERIISKCNINYSNNQRKSMNYNYLSYTGCMLFSLYITLCHTLPLIVTLNFNRTKKQWGSILLKIYLMKYCLFSGNLKFLEALLWLELDRFFNLLQMERRHRGCVSWSSGHDEERFSIQMVSHEGQFGG